MTATLIKPIIYNKTATLANTEYSQALSDFAGFVQIQARTFAELKIAFVSGDTDTLFFTIPAGSSFYINGIMVGGSTIYFQSPTAGTVVEIIEWTR